MEGKKIIAFLSILVIMILVGWGIARQVEDNEMLGSFGIEGTPKYVASAGVNQVISAGPAVLHRIILGTDVATSVIQISDHLTDATANTQFYLSGSTLSGVWDVGTYFSVGIVANVTNQTNSTFIFSPR